LGGVNFRQTHWMLSSCFDFERHTSCF